MNSEISEWVDFRKAGFTWAEIAEVVGKSATHVRTKVMDALYAEKYGEITETA